MTACTPRYHRYKRLSSNTSDADKIHANLNEGPEIEYCNVCPLWQSANQTSSRAPLAAFTDLPSLHHSSSLAILSRDILFHCLGQDYATASQVKTIIGEFINGTSTFLLVRLELLLNCDTGVKINYWVN